MFSNGGGPEGSTMYTVLSEESKGLVEIFSKTANFRHFTDKKIRSAAPHFSHKQVYREALPNLGEKYDSGL